jgi:CRISPR-associated protein Csx14
MRDRIGVDLLNPGQVFACLGIAEILDVLCGPVEGGFVGAGDEVEFVVDAEAASALPIDIVVDFLRNATVTTEAPSGSALSTAGWGVATSVRGDDVFPFREPDSLATLPAIVSAPFQGELRSIRVESWGDDRTHGRDNVKFWAGAQGKAGAAFLVDQLAGIRQAPRDLGRTFLNFGIPQPGSLRFDWRRDTISINSGFAINSHKDKIISVGYPFVEALALFGISHGRPRMFDGKLHYRYGVMTTTESLWPLSMLRMGLGAPETNLPIRVFDMILDWPGQKDQARCIVEAREVNQSKEM